MTNDLRFGWELSGTGGATCRIADGSPAASSGTSSWRPRNQCSGSTVAISAPAPR
jgi:hypothetical protein